MLRISFHFLVLCILGTGLASADTITIEGKRYTDVLIYKTSSTYYIKLPKEGRSISALVADVDETTVSINDDPYYRDELKAMYDKVKAGEAVELPDVPADPAFRVQSSSSTSGTLDSSSLLGGGGGGGASGGGGGKGLGIPRQMLQNMLTGAGAQFSGSGNTLTGKMPDGSTFQLIGPAENLTAIKITSIFPESEKATLQQNAGQITMLTGSSANWAATWIQSNIQTLMDGGTIQKTQDGVSLKISVNYSGGQGTFDFTISSV